MPSSITAILTGFTGWSGFAVLRKSANVFMAFIHFDSLLIRRLISFLLIWRWPWAITDMAFSAPRPVKTEL